MGNATEVKLVYAIAVLSLGSLTQAWTKVQVTLVERESLRLFEESLWAPQLLLAHEFCLEYTFPFSQVHRVLTILQRDAHVAFPFNEIKRDFKRRFRILGGCL